LDMKRYEEGRGSIVGLLNREVVTFLVKGSVHFKRG